MDLTNRFGTVHNLFDFDALDFDIVPVALISILGPRCVDTNGFAGCLGTGRLGPRQLHTQLLFEFVCANAGSCSGHGRLQFGAVDVATAPMEMRRSPGDVSQNNDFAYGAIGPCATAILNSFLLL